MFQQLKKHQFLFEELVKRDFKKKYKRTILGMGWSMLMPLLMLVVMKVVFSQFFGRGMLHYTTYIFCGNLIFCWFSEATNSGMLSLYGNAHIFTKVNVPKYLFLFSGIVQTLLNFALSLIVFFFFCWLDHVPFTWKFVLLLYPVATLLLFNMGMGLVLSAFYIFFRDMDYLWRVFLQLLMYGSAIFYTVDGFEPGLQLAFSLNPVYQHIVYFREIVLGGVVPSLETHLALAGFALAALLAGVFMYKHYNTKFLYYV
ncbi:MAG: ABC transporter permease [Oscillospiraceae bacterium]|nr:ABC transporter permease [Oscillospiraceae bacterium]